MMSNRDNYDRQTLKALQSIAASLKVIERNLCMNAAGCLRMCKTELTDEKEVYNNDENSGEMR